MELIYPSYYHKFRCIAGACPDSCCHEWEVQVDPEAAARYRAMEGPLGDDLRRYLYEEDGETYMKNQNNRCPMWREDGLCRIQAALGHDALCQVCQQFPRLRHDYGDFVEQGLEVSCPEAARLILSSPDWCLESREVPGGEEADYDKLDMEILRATRAEAVSILLDRTLPVNEALALLLIYGYAAQEMLDSGEAASFDREAAMASAREFAGGGDFGDILGFLGALEILTERWQTRLDAGARERAWCDADRAFGRYLVERYWLQAVSDLDLVSRVKLAVVSCLTVHGLGGDPAETAQLYSKEIENNTENVEALLDGAYTAPALTDRTLLGLLLK